MTIYDSLQRKEELKVYDIKKACNEVDADWVTLISSDYPKNLKAIYKPPFGVFCYGRTRMLSENMVTILGDLNSSNNAYLNHLRANGVNLLWPNKSNDQLLDILDSHSKNNLFYFSELKNKENKVFQKLLSNEDVRLNNAFISEIWSRNNKVDYSNQKEERMFLGLSLQLLIISDLPDKQLAKIADYCNLENIKVGVLESANSAKVSKAFASCKVHVIKNIDDLARLYFERS